ncbi:hypothetical protein BV53_03755 [Candidatus Synechococcus spongiarum LMB bulk15N]|uniref:Uncharacterized protein n=1 Tax=Candidatus Synechococcus spongiarum LMB bulk15N TaxID=1943583 RepID=A0A1T1D414_9SYNE|nr:hypothetical protein BV53_03755 [Candidatus Synechococcus spongiarum LMB bulk15N]
MQTYGEWASQRGLSSDDAGIDLVAELKDEPGAYAAIQCKFRDIQGSIAKAEIDSFLAASGRPEFRRRIWMDTTGRAWSAKAEEILRQQEKPVQRLGLHDLKASPVCWAEFVQSGGISERRTPRTPRPHQQKAINSALAHLAPGTRGTLLMACGTGKTLVGLRVAEAVAGVGGRVLVLAPSLALLSQTLRAWLDDACLPIRAFAVCSDNQTGRPRRNNADTADMDVLDLAYPATTDATALASQAVPAAPNAMTVVFATYQSSPMIGAAQQNHGLPDFDLAIADEAHRTAGALVPGEDPSPFVLIHDNTRLRADRRLYMTATPKVYAERARSRAGEFAATLCSMDDEERYGPVLHETRFGDAVDRGLLSDYRVIVLTVPESLAAGIKIRNLAEGKTLTIDEQGKMIGCLRALAKMDGEQFPEGDRAPMSRAIAFCNLVKSSRQLEATIGEVATAYGQQVCGNGEAVPSVSARHVDGTFNATARADALAFLEETPPGDIRILTNARCLTEGVDVPALDGILFMHPRKSQIEVVQAVGRVMRRSPDKKWGYVILPVVVPSLISPEQFLADDKRWQTVWQMLNAIRSHDERFEGMLNRLEMGEAGQHVSIVTLADWQPPMAADGTEQAAADPDAAKASPAYHNLTLFEGLPEAIRTRIVEKCGNKRYWEDWATDVARIAQTHVARIRALVEAGQAEREVFGTFLQELRDDLNPEVSADDAIEMLAQHMVTQPVFDALFGAAAAARRNPVSQGMQTVLDVLKPSGIAVETESLDPFYDSVRRRVQGATSAQARQAIVVELYDKFFRKAFPRVSERLGIVYTPVEIVDFILHSVQAVLAQEFGSALGEPGVHILDPFTGTGTFITRMLQSGLLSPEQILRKYGGNGQPTELHANEIILLAYYIASVNIEVAFQDATDSSYRPFDGICLTDTFALNANDDTLQNLFPDNSQRRKQQKALDIRVIVGNPPWSAGQRSATDNNPNVRYPQLEKRVKTTYMKYSINTTQRKSLYDSYKMAIRWASDRINDQGIVAFVTNGSWIDGNVDAGVRACLTEEFSSVYVLNLRGNQRTQGERSRQEGGKIFGQGSRATVAITLLVRNPNATQQGCRILYRDIGDYLSREQKLGKLREWGSISNIDDWQTIQPDRHHDWIQHRDSMFESLYPLGSQEAKRESNDPEDTIFKLYSQGLNTSRDKYIYNFSYESCASNAKSMINNYVNALQTINSDSSIKTQEIDSILSRHTSHVKWNSSLKRNLLRRQEIIYTPDKIWTTQYRPFVKQHCYFDHELVASKCQQDSIFPTENSNNSAICISGKSSNKPFSLLMVNCMPDLHFISEAQSFPRYRFIHNQSTSRMDEAPNLERVDNISDTALTAFHSHYQDPGITKDAIFDYVYGVLHAPDFRARFAHDLAKSLPRLPFAPDFQAFAQAGQTLAALHLNYESGPQYPLTPQATGTGGPLFTPRAMRLVGENQDVLVVNDHLRIAGIPPEAHRYQVNGRTPLGWFIDRYRITTDKHSGIRNDPNAWFPDSDGFIAAVGRIVYLSVETVRIVEGLPGALTGGC